MLGTLCDSLKTFLTLDLVGIVAALALGVLILVFGGLLEFAVILVFLLVSSAATRYGKGRKMRMGTYERARGWRNVAANGAVPLAMAFASFLLRTGTLHLSADLVHYLLGAAAVGYAASVAAITADKLSSEIGVLDRKAFGLLNFRRERPGVSGAVSALGLGAGALAALIMALAWGGAYVGSGYVRVWAEALLAVAIVACSGIAGDLVDSFFGYFEERGFGNKYTSNIACSLSGAVIAVVLFLLLFQPYYLM